MNAYVAEFVGTALLILFGDGVVAAVLLNKSKGQGSGWIVITTGWGLAVMIAIYAVGVISGGHFNPAVTIGLAVIGKFSGAKVLGYVVAQIAGAMFGAFLVWLAYFPHWKETPDTGAKLAVFCTAPAIRSAPSNLLCEIIGAASLVFGALAIPSSANLSGAGWATGFGRCWSDYLSLPLAFHWAGRPDMRLTRPVILAPAWRMPFCRSAARAVPIGATHGFLSLARLLAVCWAPGLIVCCILIK